VELLVVIAVIAVLAGLLLPVLAQARERARQSTCLSHLHQIGQAHLLYLQDWDEQFVGWWQDGPPRPQPFGPYLFWPELLQPYVRAEGLFHDPGASAREPTGPGARVADYAMLTRGPGGSGDYDDPYWRWAGPPLSLAQVLRPAETISVSDGVTTTVAIHGLMARHSGGMNAVFLDGHTRRLTWAQAREIVHDELGDDYHRDRYYYRHVAADW
jgi:prepilin-type processing-associated H-X9-DG protein